MLVIGAEDVGAGRRRLKHALNRVAIVLVSPAALTCAVERRLRPQPRGCFTFWTHALAVVPGAFGMFLRRAFYWWTLERCAESVTVGFGALFSRQNTIMEAGAYVGSYALIGSAWIGENTLIGSRASLLSGGRQHEWLPSGRWSDADEHRLRRLMIGANTWIGEGAIIMADVGAGCMVAAGSVVSSPVPPGVMVAGNPARFVRRLGEQQQ